MDKPIPLEQLFASKIFRVPDYQRGYAWQRDQLKAFWEDLINLKPGRSHYTGVLTLTKIDKSQVQQDSREFWLVDRGFNVHHVVDGQQRLTTVVIFIQALAECLRTLPNHAGLAPDDIYLTDSLTLADMEKTYLHEFNKKGGFKTLKFGYTDDNPSQAFLCHKIFGEQGGGSAQESFYTLNLQNAKLYFSEQLGELYRQGGLSGLASVYRNLTQRFLFNEYVIDDEFDVFVAFETMNNRGKRLSDLELLKNRLIYLTTLYGDDQIDKAGRKTLRDEINAAWKEVYHQLGRNKSKPLNDDDFLRAHWITYFKYSRDTGRDYARFLLEEHFTPRRVQDFLETDVELTPIDEQRVDDELDAQEEASDEAGKPAVDSKDKLSPPAIRAFVASLRDSAAHWFNSFHPDDAHDVSPEIRTRLDRLNRVGIGYFRPLVMVALKGNFDTHAKCSLLDKIERFVFLTFRLGGGRSNYRSSEFYNLARALDRGETTLERISEQLDQAVPAKFVDNFLNALENRFDRGGPGYYGWSGLRYLLFEYEQDLLSGSRQAKVAWADFLKHEKDKISIEHVFPQTSGEEWNENFGGLSDQEKRRFNGTLGNLLLLSSSINSSLQNDSFESKKKPLFDDGTPPKKLRSGYADGSHSEIEVAVLPTWGVREIWDRGKRILKFMERRWGFPSPLSDDDIENLLFIPNPDRSAIVVPVTTD